MEEAGLTSPDLRTRARIDSWLPLAPVLVSAALISAVIVTLGAPLIPLIQQGFAITEEQAQWSYTITLLVAAACTPIFGRLADGRHRRAVTALVCGLVALGCVIAAMADTFAMLLVGRGLQGLGVSLVAMTIAAARAYLPPRNARSTVALLSITTALGAGISYPLTTAVADHFGMSAAFALAAVFAAIVGLLVVLRLPSAFEGIAHRPDVVGALLLASGVTAYLLAITHGNSWGWTSLPVLGLGLLGTLIVVGWVVWELHIDYPLVRLPLLADRRVLAAAAVALFMGMSLYSAPVLVSRLAQMPSSTGYGAGLSLTAAGAIMIPIAVGNLLGSRITLWADRFGGARFSLALGSVLAMSGTLLIVLTHVSVVILVLAMCLTAVGAGATFGAMPALIIAAVAGEETGSAMSFNLLLRTVGGTIGSALTAAALGAHVTSDAEYPSWSGFQLAFLVCAGACFAALLAGLVLLRGPATRPLRL